MELAVECNNVINNEKCLKILLLRKENKCKWGAEEMERLVREREREKEREREEGRDGMVGEKKKNSGRWMGWIINADIKTS